MNITISRGSEGYYICKNIEPFCISRGLEMQDYKRPTEQDLLNMNKFEVKCIKDGKPIRIIYIPKGSRYNKPADLNTILVEGVETIIIKSSSTKKIKTSSLKTKITLLDGKYLLTNLTKRFTVRGYSMRVVDDEEIDHLMNLYKIPNKKCLPAISENAHEVIWLGAKIDDIVYLEYPTIASCEVSSSYRIVSNEIPLIEDEEDEAGDF
jgi:DNA-directed RNA polymerase subunit H (RpoH/RPB5)